MRSIIRVSFMVVLVVLAPLPLRARQAGGRVVVSGQVSAFAAVAAGPDAQVLKGDARVASSSDGAQGLIFTLSGTRGGETQVELPLQLRSNAAFALSASCATDGATFSTLSVAQVRGVGAFVYPAAAAGVEVAPAFDGRAAVSASPGVGPDLSSLATILTGPPISMGGTLNSPNNMIEVLLRVLITAPADEKGWLVELKVAAAGRPRTSPHARPGHATGRRE